jgi:hypothetical protein
VYNILLGAISVLALTFMVLFIVYYLKAKKLQLIQQKKVEQHSPEINQPESIYDEYQAYDTLKVYHI